MSLFLTQRIAEEAVDMVRPAIQKLMEDGRIDGTDLHIVIMDPARPCTRADPSRSWEQFEEAILYQEIIGDRKTWKYPYDDIARSKAYMTWRSGVPSRTIQTDEPWLYAEGDTRYVGSVVLGRTGSLVVAASGVEDYFDEMFSLMVAAAIQGLCRERIGFYANAKIDFLKMS